MRKLTCILSLGFTLSTMAKDVMLMNRIGPSKSELYVANADGTGEHNLLPTSGFDYHASYSYDGQWIMFTSERSGYGQADIYRVHPDGTALEQLTDDPALDDQSALSPDGTQVAFVSTRATHRANIWILDLKTKRFRDLTGQPGIPGDPMKPDGFFRPAWSPDGKWIAFTSDRNTEWKGHGNGSGWEHVQELSVYIVHPDGTGLRRITAPGICSGSPKWSPDSKQIVFYEIPVEGTWDARVFGLSGRATSQIVSVDLETGKRTEQTSGPGLKLMPQLLPDGRVGFLTKSGREEGLGTHGGREHFLSVYVHRRGRQMASRSSMRR
jgi:Tol biopolymer transport system component